MAALAAIDMALWDIKGKVTGQPVYSLLGGPTRTKLLTYVHTHGRDFAEAADEVLKAQAGGTGLSAPRSRCRGRRLRRGGRGRPGLSPREGGTPPVRGDLGAGALPPDRPPAVRSPAQHGRLGRPAVRRRARPPDADRGRPPASRARALQAPVPRGPDRPRACCVDAAGPGGGHDAHRHRRDREQQVRDPAHDRGADHRLHALLSHSHRRHHRGQEASGHRRAVRGEDGLPWPGRRVPRRRRGERARGHGHPELRHPGVGAPSRRGARGADPRAVVRRRLPAGVRHAGLGVDVDEALAARYPHERKYLPAPRREDGSMHGY